MILQYNNTFKTTIAIILMLHYKNIQAVIQCEANQMSVHGHMHTKLAIYDQNQ